MRLDLATRTLFMEFQESVFARSQLSREMKGMSTFVHKTVKGIKYWYAQKFSEGQYQQQYFGPSNQKNDAHVAKARKEFHQKKELLKQLVEREVRQASMLKRGGLLSADKRVAIVLARLSDAGLIDGNGTLVGTHAFIAYSGVLGALFEKMTSKTNDIDIVSDNSIKIAPSGSVDISTLLAGLEFRGVPGLAHGYPPASFVSKDGLRVDLLVPLRGRPKNVSLVKGIKGAVAVPLPFLDFLIASPVRTVLIGPSGGIPVQIPNPSRFAVHKLIIASRRPVSELAKKRKDIAQAAQLIEVLFEEEPTGLKQAWKLACETGKKWAKLLTESAKLLPHETQDKIRNLVGNL